MDYVTSLEIFIDLKPRICEVCNVPKCIIFFLIFRSSFLIFLLHCISCSSNWNACTSVIYTYIIQIQSFTSLIICTFSTMFLFFSWGTISHIISTTKFDWLSKEEEGRTGDGVVKWYCCWFYEFFSPKKGRGEIKIVFILSFVILGRQNSNCNCQNPANGRNNQKWRKRTSWRWYMRIFFCIK